MPSVSEVVLFLGLCAEDFLSGSLLLLVALLDLVRSSGVLLATVLLAEHQDVVVHGDLLLAHVALDVICLCKELQQKNLSFPQSFNRRTSGQMKSHFGWLSYW